MFNLNDELYHAVDSMKLLREHYEEKVTEPLGITSSIPNPNLQLGRIGTALEWLTGTLRAMKAESVDEET